MKQEKKSGILPFMLETPPLLLIDKPAGWTSHDVVAKVRGTLKIRAVGHAGTLDPFATGLLILGIGPGTKQLTALVGLDKTYETTLVLGTTSTTFDPEGELTKVVDSEPSNLTREAIDQALNQFRGGYSQKAPIYSAKKLAGQKLYDLARAGKATEEMRPVKDVTISELTILDHTWPELRLRVHCGSGTYIRSLGDDIGRALGTGAYVSQLRRTKIGAFRIEDAVQLSSITPPPSAATTL